MEKKGRPARILSLPLPRHAPLFEDKVIMPGTHAPSLDFSGRLYPRGGKLVWATGTRKTPEPSTLGNSQIKVLRLSNSTNLS